MAALRYAARRLGDHALQRLQAIYTSPAVQEAGQRRLLRAVVPTCSRRAASILGRQKHHRERLVRTHLAKIQKKKEELYSLITELDSKLPGHCTKVNKQLAIELSVQVEPKPSDPQWRW